MYFIRDKHAFQLTRGVSAETSLTIYLYIVATTFINNIGNNYKIIITSIYIVLAPIFCFTLLWNHDTKKWVCCSFRSSLGDNALNTQ